jgi:hypothetical protein
MIFVPSLMVGFVAIGAVSLQTMRNDIAWLPPIAWFLLFGIGQHFILKCPSCRKDSMTTKRGIHGVDPGTVCRWCGTEY